jgi:hypothetical protein
VALTFQSGAYELVHLLDHHAAKHGTHHSCENDHLDHAPASDQKAVFNPFDHCEGCDVLIAMDDQNMVSVSLSDFSLNVITADHYVNLTTQYKNKRKIRNTGRAPPVLNAVSFFL